MKKNVIINSKAFAYYFLQHFYRKNLETNFEDTDLNHFISFFCNYALTQKCIVINEEGDALTNNVIYKRFANDIISKYTFSVEKKGRVYCRCFKSELLPALREEYLKSKQDFKNLIYDYETAYIDEAYNSPAMLKDIEDVCAKNSKASLKFMQTYTTEKGLDA